MFSHLKIITIEHFSLNIKLWSLIIITHHLEGLGDEDSEYSDSEEDEERGSEADQWELSIEVTWQVSANGRPVLPDSGGDTLRHPALPPGQLTATQNLSYICFERALDIMSVFLKSLSVGA